ncbi:hypothetical protein N0V90_002344 [Kalmusia sp. IMI 367209]|nr:hypothetical protein N0V90_002344 [Kalmusia sp. IMI 367209]
MSLVNSVQPSAPAATQNSPSTDRWYKALNLLDSDFRKTLTSTATPKRDIVSQVLQEAEARRKECIRKQWRFRGANGKTVSLREILEKITGFVSRYKDVVTVAVQYDPVHAALPWAAVRFLLNITVGDVQVWGSLLADLETISQLMFRCAVYEDIYLRDRTKIATALEDILIKLYAEMLVVLAKSIKYFRKTTAGEYSLSLSGNHAFQSNETPGRMSAIENLEEDFMKLATLQKAKMVEQDSDRTNSSLTKLEDQLNQILDTTSQIHLQLHEEKLNSLIRWLSTVPVDSHHRAVAERRIPLFGRWLLDHHDFQEWKTSQSSACILVEGNPGSGKSTVLSAVVDDMVLQAQQASSTLCAFFYCHSSSFEAKRSSAPHIMRSIVRQLGVRVGTGHVSQLLVCTYDTIVEESRMRRTDPDELSIAECIDLLLDLTANKTAYIAIDALDELRSESRAILLEALRTLVTESTGQLKLFYTSRLNSHVQSLLHGWSMIIRVNSKSNCTDVDRFIDNEIKQAVEQKRILNGNASAALLDRIRDALKNGAEELFLWPKLQIDFLCHKKTEPDILASLDSGLTSGLDQMYGLILDSILQLDSIAKRIAKAVIAWLLFAEQPLHAKVLPAIMLWVLQGEVTETTIDVFDVCHHLIVIDSQSETYAAVHWPKHVRQSMDIQAKDVIIQGMIEFVFGNEGGNDSFAFQMWLKWLQKGMKSLPDYHHLRIRLEQVRDPSISPVLIACAFGLPILFEHALQLLPAFDVEYKGVTERTILWLACSYGNSNMVPRLLALGASPDTVCGDNGSPMSTACFKGHDMIVKLLLDHGSSIGPSPENPSPYNAACRGGHEHIALLLIQNTDLINSDVNYESAFVQATRSGFTNVVTWLRRPSFRKKFVHAYERMLEDSNSEFLSSAIKQGNVPMLQTLMQEISGPSMALPPDAIAIASLAGRGEMITFLHKVCTMDVEQEGLFGSPLRSASLMGHGKIVRLLLDLGADPNSRGFRGTSLQAASQKGHINIMEMLIEAGAEVNETSLPFDTSLRAASYHGHINAVKLLLAHGAKINRPGGSADAISAAAQRGHYEVSSLLVQRGNYGSKPRVVIHNGGGSSSAVSSTSAGNSGYYQ